MKENYGYFFLAIAIWSALTFLFSMIIILEPTNVFLGIFKEYKPNIWLFIVSMIFLGINLGIYGVGYINYKLDEKPYVIIYIMDACPLILSIIFIAKDIWFYNAFVFIPIIFNIVLLGILAIGSGGRLEGFDVKPRELLLKYLFVVFIYYGIMAFVIFLHWVTGMTTSAPPFTFAILFYAMSFIMLIPLF